MGELKVGTNCIHGGYSPENGDPRAYPLVQSTTYQYDTVDTLGDLFDLKAEGHLYSRISNPTVDALEKRIAILEGGKACVCTSSGQSAIVLSILTICKAGDSVVALANLYGGTISLFTNTLKKYGIEVRFVSIDNFEKEIEENIDDTTKAVYGETIGNPAVDVLDIEKVAAIAHRNGLPLIIDNTFATPILCQPIKYGADIVVHSTSKYIEGHGRAIGGAVVDSGKFNWENGKFNDLVEPDNSYHGLSFVKTFGEIAYALKARCIFVRDIGFVMAPFNAFLTLQGIETLEIRMKRHSENALKVAKFLEESDKISWVKYPGLKSNKSYELAEKYLNGGQSGVVTFEVKGGKEKAKKFINSLKLIAIVTHVADTRSCIIHPASTTHRQLSKEQLEKGGITEGLIRFSVGIEDCNDLIDDLKLALKEI